MEQLGQSIQEWTEQNLWKTFFKRFEGEWPAEAYIRPYLFKLFKGYLPQILLSPFLNSLSHLVLGFYFRCN